jgi:hypothetical protein
MRRLEEILNVLVDNSAGCICLDHPDGKCACAKEKQEAKEQLLALFEEWNRRSLPEVTVNEIAEDLYTSGAYWKIDVNDVGRELYVVPMGKDAFIVKAQSILAMLKEKGIVK